MLNPLFIFRQNITMKSKSAYLAERIRSVFLNGTFIANTNYKDQILHLDLKTALIKIAECNCIYELVYHVNYYIQGLNHFLKDGELTISDTFSFPTNLTPSEDEWEQLKHNFLAAVEVFALRIEQLDQDILTSTFVKKEYGDFERNIDGQIEHAYYHLGQIVLLKKIITSHNGVSSW